MNKEERATLMALTFTGFMFLGLYSIYESTERSKAREQYLEAVRIMAPYMDDPNDPNYIRAREILREFKDTFGEGGLEKGLE